MQETIEQIHETLLLCRRQGARIYELKTSICLADIYAIQGNTSKALHSLSPLLATFDEGFDTVDLVKAQELVARLEKDQQARVLRWD